MKGWQGLCLALTIFAASGCSQTPSVAFSADGKQIAYVSPDAGIVVRDTAGLGNKKVYKEPSAYQLSWSPDAKYLVWTDAPTMGAVQAEKPVKTRLLSFFTGEARTLPASLLGPFRWSKDSGSVTGFVAINETGRESDFAMKEVTLDLVSDKETEGMVGTYLPLAVFPQSNVMLVADKKDIYQLDETGITEFKGLAKINPTGFATAPEGKLLLVKSEADGKGIKNAVFFYTTGGQRQDLELPNGLAYSKLAGKKVRAICAASPDGKWLIVERREDVSKLPMLQADLVLQATPKLSAEYERRYSQFAMLSEKGKYRHGYELVERSTGRSRDIAVELAPPGLGPNAEATWSPDGAYVALGLELQQGRQGLWLMDTQSGSVAKLVDYTPPPAASK